MNRRHEHDEQDAELGLEKFARIVLALALQEGLTTTDLESFMKMKTVPSSSQAHWDQCRKNGEKPMWADMSQYSGISLSVEGVGHQFRRCLITVINLGSARLLTTVLTGKIGVEWTYHICQL